MILKDLIILNYQTLNINLPFGKIKSSCYIKSSKNDKKAFSIWKHMMPV